MKAGLVVVLALVAAPVLPQQDFSKVEVKAEKVAEGLYMLTGSGGNLGLSVGTSGTYLIDDQYAPLTDKILAAIRAITPDPVRFVVNTHWHGDHTGGNENLGKAGALLVAHENVRQRMSTEQFMAAMNRKTPPSPEGALPVVTLAARDRIAKLKAEGKSRDEVIAAKPPADRDAKGGTGFKTGDSFVSLAYDPLK